VYLLSRDWQAVVLGTQPPSPLPLDSLLRGHPQHWFSGPLALPLLDGNYQGQAVQYLHVGPYNSMGGAVSTMQAFAESNGLELAGKHHDVYLSDPRRTAPDKLKAVLRRPVR